MAVKTGGYYTMRLTASHGEQRPRILNGIQTAVIIHNPLAGGGHGRRAQQLDAARRVLGLRSC